MRDDIDTWLLLTTLSILWRSGVITAEESAQALHLAVCQPQRSMLASFDRERCAAAEHDRIALERLEIPLG